MATLSGDQKQKLFVLGGFLGVLVVVGFFAMRGGKSEKNAPEPAATPAAAGLPAGAPTAAKPPKPAATTPATTAKAPPKTDAKGAKPVLVKAAVIPAPVKGTVEASRPDPFEPFYFPTPEPTATPTPM